MDDAVTTPDSHGLDQRVVLVTGAASGIGAATAQLLLHQVVGARLRDRHAVHGGDGLPTPGLGRGGLCRGGLPVLLLRHLRERYR